MKCEIKWVDDTGKATPDENEAVAMAHAHEVTTWLNSGKVECTYGKGIRGSYPICQKHLDSVAHLRATNRFAGAWSFGSLQVNEPSDLA